MTIRNRAYTCGAYRSGIMSSPSWLNLLHGFHDDRVRTASHAARARGILPDRDEQPHRVDPGSFRAPTDAPRIHRALRTVTEARDAHRGAAGHDRVRRGADVAAPYTGGRAIGPGRRVAGHH